MSELVYLTHRNPTGIANSGQSGLENDGYEGALRILRITTVQASPT